MRCAHECWPSRPARGVVELMNCELVGADCCDGRDRLRTCAGPRDGVLPPNTLLEHARSTESTRTAGAVPCSGVTAARVACLNSTRLRGAGRLRGTAGFNHSCGHRRTVEYAFDPPIAQPRKRRGTCGGRTMFHAC